MANLTLKIDGKIVAVKATGSGSPDDPLVISTAQDAAGSDPNLVKLAESAGRTYVYRGTVSASGNTALVGALPPTDKRYVITLIDIRSNGNVTALLKDGASGTVLMEFPFDGGTNYLQFAGPVRIALDVNKPIYLNLSSGVDVYVTIHYQVES